MKRERVGSLPSGWLLVEEESPRDFLSAHGLHGRVGLLGGASLGHRLVRWGQAPITADRRWSLWSHAVIFAQEEGRRVLYESDFDLRGFPPRLRNGAQLSPIEKYFDPKRWPYMCILDFELTQGQMQEIIDECRLMITRRIRYALGGLVAAGIFYRFGRAIRVHSRVRPRGLFCSAFVQEAFMRVGIRFQEHISLQHLGPEHIWHTSVPHLTYIRHKEWEALRGRQPRGDLGVQP